MYLKHGRSQSPEYKAWQQLKARCLNSNHQAYPDYGGRGIAVHPEWISDFMAFFAHVGPRPSSKHSLDRLNNSEGYRPGNVAWRTRVEQLNNRRPHRKHGVKPRPRPTRTDGETTNYKHGMIDAPEYGVWTAMKDRCLNPRSSNYVRYGGRGIKIHQPWVEDFMTFYQDMGPRPSPQLSLDRMDNEKGYFPQNCRWATKLQQSENRGPFKTGPDHGNHKHGHTKTPTYSSWGSIKTRCFNPKADNYARYGALGITMCQRWQESFEAFLEDLGPKPEKHMVMREDADGHYSCGTCSECQEKGWPSNCRWATRTEINRHRRSVKLTGAKVGDIHRRLSGGAPDGVVAQAFGVASSLVGKIRRGENWA